MGALLQQATPLSLAQAVQPLPKDRVLTLRTLLKLTDELRAHVLGGRLEQAGATQNRRDALLHAFFEQSVSLAERNAMIEACCAMLDMDRAVLSCLEINRNEAARQLLELRRDASGAGVYRAI